MMWVERRAQLWALVSCLVTKPGVAICENARIIQFYFLTDLPSRTSISNHIGLVWDGSAKKWHFAPNLTPYRFQKFKPHFFYSSPSLADIRSADLMKSHVNDKRRAQVRGWVKIRQRFLGMASLIFVRFLPSSTDFIRPESRCCFFDKFPRLIAMLDVV